MNKAGTLLETTIKRIFDSVGFKTRQNIRIKSYEVDVLAEHDGYTIAVECKTRETGRLVVRNLIHEWAGKNKIINADKVLLAVYGVNIKISDKKLAESNNIAIWNERNIEKFLDLAMKKGPDALAEILDSLDIKTEKTVKKRRKRILGTRGIVKIVSETENGDFIDIDFLDKIDFYFNDEVTIRSVERKNIISEYCKVIKITKKAGGTVAKFTTSESSFFTGEEVEVIPQNFDEINRIISEKNLAYRCDYQTSRVLENKGRIKVLVIKGENVAHIELICPKCKAYDYYTQEWKKVSKGTKYRFETKCPKCGNIVKVEKLKT